MSRWKGGRLRRTHWSRSATADVTATLSLQGDRNAARRAEQAAVASAARDERSEMGCSGAPLFHGIHAAHISSNPKGRTQQGTHWVTDSVPPERAVQSANRKFAPFRSAKLATTYMRLIAEVWINIVARTNHKDNIRSTHVAATKCSIPYCRYIFLLN
jgi:hypothetical protein